MNPLPVTLKDQVCAGFLNLLTEKIQRIESELTALSDSLQKETKSTAGDKYETGRAMLHREQEQWNLQLAEARQQMAVMNGLSTNLSTGQVVQGSLVLTNKGYFLLAAALGKARLAGIQVYALSTNAPLGRAMLGHKTGAQFSLNGQDYIIEAIL